MRSSQYKKQLKGQYKKLPKNGTNNCILLVCSDIFGITPALQAFFNDWSGELLLISPYAKQQHFSDDEKAYQYFQQQGGLDNYRQKLRQTLHQLAIAQQTRPQKVVAVGFSAGAAALWCELGYEITPELKDKSSSVSVNQTTSVPQLVQRAFCFYGGQIRHFTELSPGCPTTLIWAQERHFDVKALVTALSGKKNVSNSYCGYSHGFINPKSAGYHKQGAAYYRRWLMSQLLGAKLINSKVAPTNTLNTTGFPQQVIGKPPTTHCEARIYRFHFQSLSRLLFQQLNSKGLRKPCGLRCYR